MINYITLKEKGKFRTFISNLKYDGTNTSYIDVAFEYINITNSTFTFINEEESLLFKEIIKHS